MSTDEQYSDQEFRQAVFILTNEYLHFLESEVSAREIGLWVDSIPRRFPRFKIGQLLAAVKELINEKVESHSVVGG